MTSRLHPLPPLCENIVFVRATGVVSGTFGTVGFGGSFLQLSMKTRGCFVIWGWGWYFRDVDCCMHTAVFAQPSVFLVLQEHTGMPSGVAVPAAFPGIRTSLSSPHVMSATASPCGTIVALAGSDP